MSWDLVDLDCAAVTEQTRCLSVDLLYSLLPAIRSMSAAGRIAACESLKTPTVYTPCNCNMSLFLIATSSVSQMVDSLALNTSICPVPTKVWRDIHSVPWLHIAGAPTRPLSERDPSVHHIQTPALNFGFCLSCSALRGSFGCSGVFQYSGPKHWFCSRGRPVHAICCPPILMRFAEYSAYWCTGKGVPV